MNSILPFLSRRVDIVWILIHTKKKKGSNNQVLFALQMPATNRTLKKCNKGFKERGGNGEPNDGVRANYAMMDRDIFDSPNQTRKSMTLSFMAAWRDRQKGSPYSETTAQVISINIEPANLVLQPVIISFPACSILYRSCTGTQWSDRSDEFVTFSGGIARFYRWKVKILVVHRRRKYGASTARGIMIV